MSFIKRSRETTTSMEQLPTIREIGELIHGIIEVIPPNICVWQVGSKTIRSFVDMYGVLGTTLTNPRYYQMLETVEIEVYYTKIFGYHIIVKDAETTTGGPYNFFALKLEGTKEPTIVVDGYEMLRRSLNSMLLFYLNRSGEFYPIRLELVDMIFDGSWDAVDVETVKMIPHEESEGNLVMKEKRDQFNRDHIKELMYMGMRATHEIQNVLQAE